MLTQDRLKELLTYNPDNGHFVWRESRGNISAGYRAGSIERGYEIIGIDRKPYRAHRLAWLYVYGEFPIQEIDHINHDRADNRIDNLRCVDRAENAKNKRIADSSYSGVSGVSWYKNIRRWVARIKVNGKDVYLGTFTDFDKAVDTMGKAKKEYGYHENHGL